MRAVTARNAARILAVAWALFWVLFGGANALGDHLAAEDLLMHALVPGGLFLATALIALAWEAAGGALLVAEGLVITVGYPLMLDSSMPFAMQAFVLLTMGLPPLLAGSLLLRIRTSQTRGAAH